MGGWLNPERERAWSARYVRVVLDFLDRHDGDSWTERWRASGADAAGGAWHTLLAAGTGGARMGNFGIGALIVLGAVRPSLD